MSTQPNSQQQFFIQLAKHKFKIEAVLTALALAAWFVGEPQELLQFTLFALAAFYFISAYLISSVKELFGVVATKVSGIGGAVCLTGLVFMKLGMEGWMQMLLVGFLSMVPVVLILLFYWMKSHNTEYLILIIRSTALAIITGYIVIPQLQNLEG
ncbi:MAG: hypothetical protein HRU69_05060 [Flammeovirgaceae bacterium]|nr:MAG: hypothetical protein HRU69_05060 [Flammeovirgaceae bacterium]